MSGGSEACDEQVEIIDVPGRSRYEVHADGQLAGFSDYKREGGQLAILHTEVDPNFGGRGLGGRLTTHALEIARREDLTVLPFCPFARDYIAGNHEYLDLVALDQRERFGLPNDD